MGEMNAQDRVVLDSMGNASTGENSASVISPTLHCKRERDRSFYPAARGRLRGLRVGCAGSGPRGGLG